MLSQDPPSRCWQEVPGVVSSFASTCGSHSSGKVAPLPIGVAADPPECAIDRDPDSVEVVELNRSSRLWALALLGALVAGLSAGAALWTQSIVSKEFGNVGVSALAAAGASIGWAVQLFGFVFAGGMVMIGKAMGEDDPIRAGRYTRLIMFVAVMSGLLGTAVFLPLTVPILNIFGQASVTRAATPIFQILASFLVFNILVTALGGIFLGLLYAHAATVIFGLSGCVALCIFSIVFYCSDIGLLALPIGQAVSSVVLVCIALAYLLRPQRRLMYGFGRCLQDVSLADLAEFRRSIGMLTVRSFCIETRFLIGTILAIRLGTAEGAVYSLLFAQIKLVDSITSGFGAVVDAAGARLWAAGDYQAFWIIVLLFILGACTPLAIVFVTITLSLGRQSIIDNYAAEGDMEDFDRVLSDGVFSILVVVTILRSFYSVLENALIATGHFRPLAANVLSGFVVSLLVSVAGFANGNFAVVYLGELVFLLWRISLGSCWLGRELRSHPLQLVDVTSTNPLTALRGTIKDPTAADLFGSLA